jgi:hypothetical protein
VSSFCREASTGVRTIEHKAVHRLLEVQGRSAPAGTHPLGRAVFAKMTTCVLLELGLHNPLAAIGSVSPSESSPAVYWSA